MKKNTPIRISELNEAIIKVLNTQFKKDAKEAHELVASYGYKIYKYDGCFRIENPLTKRYVFIDEGYNGAFRIHINTKERRMRRYEDLYKFDFVNFLEKPLNVEWAKLYWGKEYAPSRERISALSSAKWTVSYREKEIKQMMKKLEDLQNELIRQVEWKEQAKRDLADLRKTYGLTK